MSNLADSFQAPRESRGVLKKLFEHCEKKSLYFLYFERFNYVAFLLLLCCPRAELEKSQTEILIQPQ